MLLALMWGAVAGSAVFMGALVGIFVKIQKKMIGYIMAFGTGVLLGAASFELLNESIELGGLFITSIGFLLGAGVFTVIDLIIASKGGQERKRSKQNPGNHAGLAIFFGTLLDAIPESVIIGVSLIGNNVSWLLVIAIFISNFPEGLSSSIGLKEDGYSNKRILLLWSTVLVLSSLCSVLGYVFLQDVTEGVISGINAFAAGGIVAMISSTMMPEAHEEGGPVTGMISALGLICAVYLTSMG